MQSVRRVWDTIRLAPRDQTVLAWLGGVGLVCLLHQYVYPGGQPAPFVVRDALVARAATFRLDINRAAPSEWLLLPGIGESLAQRIVESRHLTGPFQTPDDLRRVRGIGPKTLDRIRPYLLPASSERPNGHL